MMTETKTLQPYIVHREEGQHLWYGGVLSSVRATVEQTGGSFGLVDDLMSVGYETPYHIHHQEDEAFYIIDGEMEFVTQGRTVKGTAGTFVFLPRKIAHGFRVVGDRPARVLIWVLPSGFEQFFVAMSTPAESLTLPEFKPFDMPTLVRTAERFGLEVLGPLSLGEGDSAR